MTLVEGLMLCGLFFCYLLIGWFLLSVLDGEEAYDECNVIFVILWPLFIFLTAVIVPVMWSISITGKYGRKAGIKIQNWILKTFKKKE